MTAKNQYTPEAKIAIVRLVKNEGRSASSIANEYGIHENTIYK